MIEPAYRMKTVKPHAFAQLNARKAQLRTAGMDIISLDMGSPDLPPAPHIVEALVRAARDPRKHGYGAFGGSLALKRAFADYYARRFEVELNPEIEVLPLLGSKEGIYHLSFAFLNPDDVSLVPDPGYPIYAAGAQLAGATVHFIPLTPTPFKGRVSTDGRGEGVGPWLPDFDAIPRDVLKRAKLLWLNYPNNPTTATASLAFFERAVAFCKRHNILLCHDNPYCEIGFDGYEAPSVLQVCGAKEIAVEFVSLSKSYNMAGMRVGALVGNAEVVKVVAALKSQADTGHFQGIEEAAIAALTCDPDLDEDWRNEQRYIYQERRDVCVAGLRAAGCDVEVPKATIYVWAKIPPYAPSSTTWAAALLENAGASVTPGAVFGECGEGYIRVALCTPTERLREAMERIVDTQSAPQLSGLQAVLQGVL